MNNIKNNINNNMEDNHNNNDNATNNNNDTNNIRPKRLSSIKAINSIISINNTYKRKSNNNTLINIDNNNLNINQLKDKKIKPNQNIDNNNNNSILLNANNILIPAILSECLSYSELKELNLIITRVNKYWKNHTYSHITLGYRRVILGEREYKLLSQNIYPTGNHNHNQAVNLLNCLKYTSNIRFWSLISGELFLYVINHVKYVQTLTIQLDEGFNYLELNDDLCNTVRLDKLESLHITAHSDYPCVQGDGNACDYLLKTLMKRANLDKITSISLQGTIPVHAKPLQLFENNPLINLMYLSLELRPNPVSNDSLNYLSALTQLIQLHLIFTNNKVRPSMPNWSWLTKLINLQEVTTTILSYTLALSLSHQANYVKALTSLPKLRKLTIFDILNLPDESIQLFSQLKLLTSLSIFWVERDNTYDSNMITFPTISNLTHLTMKQCDPICIIPILKSNPQITSIELQYCYKLTAEVMLKILPLTSALLSYSSDHYVDFIAKCSTTYPDPLVTFSPFYERLINPTIHQPLITRLQQHLLPNYKCSNPTCV